MTGWRLSPSPLKIFDLWSWRLSFHRMSSLLSLIDSPMAGIASHLLKFIPLHRVLSYIAVPGKWLNKQGLHFPPTIRLHLDVTHDRFSPTEWVWCVLILAKALKKGFAFSMVSFSPCTSCYHKDLVEGRATIWKEFGSLSQLHEESCLLSSRVCPILLQKWEKLWLCLSHYTALNLFVTMASITITNASP